MADTGSPKSPDETAPTEPAAPVSPVHEPARTREFIYRRLGFYRALKAEPPEDVLRSLLDGLEVDRARQQKLADESFDAKKKLVHARAGNHQEKLAEEKKVLESLAAQSKEWRERRKALEEELEKIDEKIRNGKSKLAQQKAAALEERFARRLEEVGKELDGIIDRYLLLSRKIHGVSKEVFEGNTEVYAARRERLSKRRDCAERSYAIACDRIARLGEAGLTVFSLWVMNIIGWAGVVASGWFYSVFVVHSNGLESDDYLSFALKRAITFIQNNFAGNSLLSTVGILLSGWALLLASATLVIWICQDLLEKWHPASDPGDHPVFTPDEEKLLGRTRISPDKRALVLWLTSVPYLFVTGVALILLARFGSGTPGSPVDDLNKLLLSLSGKLIGGAITLVLIGFAVVYVTFVVDRRLFRHPPDQGGGLGENWEIFSLMGAFLVLIIVLLIFPGWEARGVALASFAVIALLTAFTLAYSIRYLGIYDAERRWDRHILRLSQAIEVNLRPRPLDAGLIDNSEFRTAFRNALRGLSDIISLRNLAVKELYEDQASTRRSAETRAGGRVHLPNILDRLRAILVSGPPASAKPKIVSAGVTRVEERLFPEIVSVIADLREDWKTKRAEFDDLPRKIDDVEARRSATHVEKGKKIQELEEKIRACDEESIRLDERRAAQAQALSDEYRIAEVYIRDGVELGPWYRLLSPDVPPEGPPNKEDDKEDCDE